MKCVICNKKIKTTKSDIVYSFKNCCDLEYVIANYNNSIAFITGINKIITINSSYEIKINVKTYNKEIHNCIENFEEAIPLTLNEESRIKNMYNRLIEFSKFINNDLFL